MSGHGLAFPDLESAAIKEQYPDPDDTRLLKRFQANWIKYNEYWDTDTKRELLGLISGGDVKTNETNRSGPSGHKFWKRKDELTWALWIAMRTHYGIEKLAKLQAKLAVQFPQIVASSWVCPDQQLKGIQMANAESDDGPLCIKPEEHSGKPLQGSLATSEGGEVDDLEAQTHIDSDSRKRAHSGTPGGPKRAKRTAVPLAKMHPPTHHSLAIGPPQRTPQRRSILDRMEDVRKEIADIPKDMSSMISRQIAGFPSNDTHIGTPLPMNNDSLLQRRDQGGRGGPQDVSAESIELTRTADRRAKIREVMDKIVECVNELTASIMPEEMDDLKRSVDDLRSTTETNREEIQEAKETTSELQRRVEEQQHQIDSQGLVIGQMEDAMLSVWQKLHQPQEQSPRYSQWQATPRYTGTALHLNRTLPNATEQYSVTNSTGGRAPMIAGSGTAQPNTLPRGTLVSQGGFDPTRTLIDPALQHYPQTQLLGDTHHPRQANRPE
ncbi:uncharacterized protein FSUBG_5249 [Fusarium subglutinans]|uniref:Uncharacterized protein n=1 Tax=Gibberella subglutinans TaxID=42677 RepID=A0A8H5Q213_GIBSU|nr:uncharacterized protein FSUBG_5249 [Fusarium subglutinans]KAF5607350.1 hypothetical protein FSUBG_5249 [Fusarium subglutinans]